MQSLRESVWISNQGRLLQVGSIFAGLLIWGLIASTHSEFILPSPRAVLERLLDPAFDLELLRALAGSLQAMLVGFALAMVIAVPIAVLMGRIPRLDALLDPIVNALYAIPAVAFVPFFVIWFGLFFPSRVAIVFVMVFTDVLVVVAAGARDIRSTLLDVGRSLGASRLQLGAKVIAPAMLPFLMTALRVGSARAINGMITGELFFAAVNLGEMMKASARTFDTAGVLAVVTVVCLVGLAAQSIIAVLEARFLRWHLRT